RIQFDGVATNSNKCKVLLRPLLWVCHNLRVIAYSQYCSHFKMDPKVTPFLESDGHYMFKGRRGFDYAAYAYLGHPTHQLAKELDIELYEEDIYSGRALTMISQAPYDGCAFPLARKVTIMLLSVEYFSRYDDSPAKAARTEANIGAFVERIRKMAPRASEIGVRPKDLDNFPEITSSHFGSLVSRLFQLTGRIEYARVDDNTVPMKLNMDKICGLVSVKCTFESVVGNISQFIQLVRQNAPTLQSVEVEAEHAIDVCGLIRGPGGYVTYPRLTSLKLWGSSEPTVSQRPTIGGVVPFPSLQCLCLKLDHPFGDDTLFRGNSSTLECLEVGLDSMTVNMLRSYKVFTPTSHPKLQCVKIGHYGELVPDPFSTVAECTRFVLSIAPGAAVREMHGAPTNASILPAFSANGPHTCIQVLSLPRTSLTLWDAITLVKSLPLLTDLYTSPPTLGLLPAGVTLAVLPTFIRSNYAPLNEQFRCWHLKFHMFGEDDQIVVCVLVMALACPNFDYAVPSIGRRRSFMELLEKTIATDRFKRYAPRLRRLVFNGWNGKEDSSM
ncbi:hypothetical protein H4S07_004938, partial [Coemansia furcata]